MDVCLSPARLPLAQGRGGGGDPARGTMRRPLSARNLSSVGAGSGSRRTGGPEVEAVGEVGGAQGRGAGRGLWATGGPSVVTRIQLSGPARLGCAQRQRHERGADEAPVAGPMASCASIDIEDATQHLRDILKLDRPAGGEPGQRGWAFAE